MPISQILSLNKNYKKIFKFCFVRNPYDRFISTFLDLRNPKSGHDWAVNIRKFNTINDFCENFTNSEFQDWIHFKQQIFFTHCNGENIMDFIGKFENFKSDFNSILDMRNIKLPNKINHFRKTNYNLTFYQSIKNYLLRSTKASIYLNSKSIEIINNHYQKDFIEFNYEFK